MDWISVKDEIAPKDGRPFLCYDANQIDNFPHACIYVVRWVEETSYSHAGYIEAGGECYFEWNPTHWMPLPTLPKD